MAPWPEHNSSIIVSNLTYPYTRARFLSRNNLILALLLKLLKENPSSGLEMPTTQAISDTDRSLLFPGFLPG
jgi:hypothetical protein